MPRPKGVETKVMCTRAPLEFAAQFEAHAASHGQSVATRLLHLMRTDMTPATLQVKNGAGEVVTDVTFGTPVTGRSTGHRHLPGKVAAEKTQQGVKMVKYICAEDGCGAELPWRKATT